MKAAFNTPKDESRPLYAGSYLIVAMVAFLLGMVLGVLSCPGPGGSRVGWPPPPANPRSFNP